MIIELEDIDVESLSKETLDLVSLLAAEIFQLAAEALASTTLTCCLNFVAK